MLSRLSFAVRRRTRRRAREFAGFVAVRAPLNTVDQLALLGGDFLGVNIRLVREQLAQGRLADSRRSGDEVTIRMSPTCTTEFHTVAHELGHLMLNHTHVSTHCVEQDALQSPEGFERLYLAFFTDESRESVEDELEREEEAELFATELMRRLETVNEPDLVHVWASGI